jgi:cyclomaltodextrinase / maltogenic alpha-amylase / neopullulanase
MIPKFSTRKGGSDPSQHANSLPFSFLSTVGIMILLAGASTTTAQQISLDGGWQFAVDNAQQGIERQWFLPSADKTTWEPVTTPAFWESYPSMAGYDGWGWFARSFVLSSTSRPFSIYFAGVDDDAVVWVNGKEVGNHTGYSDPFAVDISQAVHAGENQLVVLVKDNDGGGGIYRPVTLIETARLDEMLRSPYFGKPALRSADWVRDGAIYCVYLRSFSPEGTFAGLERRLSELKDLGVNIVWLMPIHPVGEKRRKGNLGSPYAVRDYYGINPEFGTMDDFKRLVAAVHTNGMKLIIDLVANHTSWDSKLLVEHPEWFSRNAKGQIVAPNEDWTDVADLDYSQRGLREYMMRMMVWWVRDAGIDGFRCDVAEMVPTDFWEAARAALNRVRPVVMLSEGSLPEHHMKAFDLTYSWNIYDALEPLLAGRRPVALLDQILRTEQNQFPTGALRMRFTTNHDKNAWDNPAIRKFGHDGLKLATVLVTTMPGIPMIYNGEEVANDAKLSLFEKVNIDWRRSHEMGKLYRTLLQMRKTHRALSRGHMVRVQTDSDADVYAYFRVAGADRVLVLLNFSGVQKQLVATMPWGMALSEKKVATFKEVFTGARVQVTAGAPQAKFVLGPKGFQVFQVE